MQSPQLEQCLWNSINSYCLINIKYKKADTQYIVNNKCFKISGKPIESHPFVFCFFFYKMSWQNLVHRQTARLPCRQTWWFQYSPSLVCMDIFFHNSVCTIPRHLHRLKAVMRDMIDGKYLQHTLNHIHGVLLSVYYTQIFSFIIISIIRH